MLIWLLDSSDEHSVESDRAHPIQPIESQGSLFGRVFAVLCVAVFWAPFVGLGLSIVAIIMNYRVAGWPRVVSRIGAVLSAIITIVFCILLAISPAK